MTITKKSRDIVMDISEKIPTFHHHYHILYDIANVFKGGVIYLEIGAYAGASATLLLSNNKVKKVISVDLGEPIKYTDTINNIRNYIGDRISDYSYIKGSSYDTTTFDMVKKELKKDKVNILFIDGDHTYNGVRNDFEIYKDLVSEGGYIIFDDYHCDSSKGVREYVNVLINSEYCKDNYEIIGCLDNIHDAKPNTLKISNEFIIRKLYKNK